MQSAEDVGATKAASDWAVCERPLSATVLGTRKNGKRIRIVNEGLSGRDKEFLLSFEKGEPEWDKCCAGDLSLYPSVQWKLQNIAKLKSQNLGQFEDGVTKLKEHFGL